MSFIKFCNGERMLGVKESRTGRGEASLDRSSSVQVCVRCLNLHLPPRSNLYVLQSHKIPSLSHSPISKRTTATSKMNVFASRFFLASDYLRSPPTLTVDLAFTIITMLHVSYMGHLRRLGRQPPLQIPRLIRLDGLRVVTSFSGASICQLLFSWTQIQGDALQVECYECGWCHTVVTAYQIAVVVLAFSMWSGTIYKMYRHWEMLARLDFMRRLAMTTARVLLNKAEIDQTLEEKMYEDRKGEAQRN